MRLKAAPILVAALLCLPAAAQTNALDAASSHQPWEVGVIAQGGFGITDNRDGFKFIWAGVHVGRVLTNNFGKGPFHGNFEYAGDIFPYFEAFTPVFPRVSLKYAPGTTNIIASAPYNVGGTFHGASITPIILRWNFTSHRKLQPYAQAAGGLLYTTHKFPSYGNTDVLNYTENGPNGETSVWNFTPQGGVGLHYFTKPNRSIDFGATGMHISSASLGDRNPGVNASVQFSVGYSWWK